MKVIIIAGFLGAGKTTVLLQLAAYLTANSAQTGRPLVILENEISENGVDNKLLASRGFQVTNIFSGCICCSSSGQLCEDVLRIEREYSPQWLIIEATGLAYPDTIKNRIEDNLHLLPGVLVIADAKRWKKTMIGMRQFIESQLLAASAVIVSKTDLVSPEWREQVISELQSLTGERVPVCPINATEQQSADFWHRLMESLMGGQ